ncbi:MAG TPA: TIGR02391 family protein, partial [Terriglobales bacterium]|nr:TIGR02391 family protein [Terriglobales bacterium]
MTAISDSAWHLLDTEVRASAEVIATAGKYDDAIFAAYRLVEAKLQEHVRSQSIGQALVAEAFDGPTPIVDISNDARDRESIRQLFSGALGHIRNDRGHKRSPSVPCPDAKTCFQYLATASLLLFYLERDRNLRPTIDGIRLFGTIASPTLEIRGERLNRIRAVESAGLLLSTAQHSSSLVEICLPGGFQGTLSLTVSFGEPLEIPCDTRALAGRPENVYEVVAADVPLFSDAACQVRRENVVGILLRVTEAGGRVFERISPTERGLYRAGQYVTHGPFDEAGIAESWYLDPTSGGCRSAWQGALIARPHVIGTSGHRSYVSIHVLPGDVRL